MNEEINLLSNEPFLLASGDAQKSQFDLTIEEEIITTSIKLSRQSIGMLEKIDEMTQQTKLPFNNKFRLELRPTSFYDKDIDNKLWQLRMNIDPVTWFDLKWRECGSTEEHQRQCLEEVWSYVRKYRLFVPQETSSVAFQEPITVPQYCKYPLSCKNRFPDHPKHARLVCNVIARGQRNNGNHPCGQYFMDESFVMQWPVAPIMNLFPNEIRENMIIQAGINFDYNEANFIFQAKKETTRDLIIFPMPQWHLSNRELVKLPLFWATAILTSKLLHAELKKKLLHDQVKWPVEAIAVNFGKWETAGSYDEHLTDCHAHAHILLDSTFVSNCDDVFFRAIKGRIDDPPDYSKQNAKLLQSERLEYHEFYLEQKHETFKRLINVENKLEKLETRVKSMDDKLDQIFNLLKKAT